MIPLRNRRRSRPWRLLSLATLAAAGLAVGAIWTNAFAVGDRFEGLLARIELAIDPPPDRPTRPTVVVTPRPGPVAAPPTDPSTGPTTDPSTDPSTGPSAPSAKRSPSPVRSPVDVSIVADPEAAFASQLNKDWCAVAGTQMVLAVLGPGDASDAFQRELAGRIDEWESWQDSHNGGWGPAAIAEALAAYGIPGYEIRAYDTRADALRDSAIAISQTGEPVVLLTWRGAHTWVMTGYRADADPTIFEDATVSGAYILDPWYPRVSSIWGPSDPAGTFQDAAEMERNFLPWKRPEGRYPDRDGRYVVLVPTILEAPAG
jgi:hypothetical protein